MSERFNRRVKLITAWPGCDGSQNGSEVLLRPGTVPRRSQLLQMYPSQSNEVAVVIQPELRCLDIQE